ncbi:MAG: hypothetical protein JSW28_01385 [Thermoplasmata archaeon]|nr:MAG: hypothetical protein JSW28_01385 [Thermoplasmata archaeon]
MKEALTISSEVNTQHFRKLYISRFGIISHRKSWGGPQIPEKPIGLETEKEHKNVKQRMKDLEVIVIPLLIIMAAAGFAYLYLSDTDGDGITDDVDDDDDGDGLADWWEKLYGLDPKNPDDADEDLDGDGLVNSKEYEFQSNPQSADTDDDGLSDSEELVLGFPGRLIGGYYNTILNDSRYFTNALNNDTDGDGISDGEEVILGLDGYITNATNNDTDGDGIHDLEELEYGEDNYITDPTREDLRPTVVIDGVNWTQMLFWNFSNGYYHDDRSWGEWALVDGILEGYDPEGNISVYFFPFFHGGNFTMETKVRFIERAEIRDVEAQLLTRDSHLLNYESGMVLFAEVNGLTVRHMANKINYVHENLNVDMNITYGEWYVMRFTVYNGTVSAFVNDVRVYISNITYPVGEYHEPHLAVSCGTAGFEYVRILVLEN